jgi:hypothetical protein
MLACPWGDVPALLLKSIEEKVATHPDGFDIVFPKEILGSVALFLGYKKLFWHRVTHLSMDEQCVGIATTYDLLLRHEAER